MKRRNLRGVFWTPSESANFAKVAVGRVSKLYLMLATRIVGKAVLCKPKVEIIFFLKFTNTLNI